MRALPACTSQQLAVAVELEQLHLFQTAVAQHATDPDSVEPLARRHGVSGCSTAVLEPGSGGCTDHRLNGRGRPDVAGALAQLLRLLVEPGRNAITEHQAEDAERDAECCQQRQRAARAETGGAQNRELGRLGQS
jgi:hypothetical protein